MSDAARIAGIVQSLSLLALVFVFLNPNAGWSIRARLPVALIAFAASAAHLAISIA